MGSYGRRGSKGREVKYPSPAFRASGEDWLRAAPLGLLLASFLFA